MKELENPKFKKGDKVVMHSCFELFLPKYKGKVWVCKNDSYIRKAGDEVVYLEDFEGCFPCEYLEIVQIESISIQSILTRQLTRDEQSELLSTLFGFSFENDVLIDDEGDEFYGYNNNCQFDFSTLAGIFGYTAHRAKNQGYLDAQFHIKKALGIS